VVAVVQVFPEILKHEEQGGVAPAEKGEQALAPDLQAQAAQVVEGDGFFGVAFLAEHTAE